MDLSINSSVCRPNFTAVHMKQGTADFIRTLESKQVQYLKDEIAYFVNSKFLDLTLSNKGITLEHKTRNGLKKYTEVSGVDFAEPGCFDYITYEVRSGKDKIEEFTFPSNIDTVTNAKEYLNESGQVLLKTMLGRQLEYWENVSHNMGWKF